MIEDLFNLQMPFVNKMPCTVARVLALEACPPHDVLHSPSEYPKYYDALYYPQFNQNVFRTPLSVCVWLCAALENHYQDCGACCQRQRDFRVDYDKNRILVTLGSRAESLSIVEVESPTFTLCRVFRRFNSSLCDLMEPNLKLILLTQNPSWCYRTDADFARALTELPKPDLSHTARRLQTDRPVSKLRKDDLVSLIVRDFVRERITLLSLPDAEILSVVPDIVCGHRACALGRIVHRRYGPLISTALRKFLSEDDFKQPARDYVDTQSSASWLKMSHRDMLLLMQRCHTSNLFYQYGQGFSLYLTIFLLF